MKLVIRHPKLEDVYQRIREVADTCWTAQGSWIPNVLDEHRPLVDVFRGKPDAQHDWSVNEYHGRLHLAEEAVIYTTCSNKGRYIYRPDRFEFHGHRGSLRDGSACGGWNVIYGENGGIRRIDVEFTSPISPAVYAGIYVDGSDGGSYELETSTPDVPISCPPTAGQLTEQLAEADQIRAELEIPDTVVCHIEKTNDGLDVLVVEVDEGNVSGALRAAAYEIDVLGRDVLLASASRLPASGVKVRVWLGEEVDDEEL